MKKLYLTLLLLCLAAGQSRGEDGSHLFINRGCLGCHGASGRGGVGPALANTQLSFSAFIGQVRSPRGIMPQFPSKVVGDKEVQDIYNYLREAPPPPPRLRTDLPHGIQAEDSCAPCHEKLNPVIVQQFTSSAMGQSGRQNAAIVYPLDQISCAVCHGNNHDDIMASKGRVPETICGGCHIEIYQQHVLDLGHSYGPGPGDLGVNWERNIGVPHYRQMPRKVMEMGCDACHAQAGATDAVYWDETQKKYIDTSSLTMRNGCVACHTRHAFDLQEARKPEACYTCHMGPDHPNYEAYISSKHGSLFAARSNEWNWSERLADAKWDAPTCAYCHMLYVNPDGSRASSHNMTRKLIWGMGVQAATGSLVDITVSPQNRARRDEMIRVCITCHSEDRAREYLESADAHKLAGDALVVEARRILEGLYNNGLIRPSHDIVSAGLLPGPRFTAIDLPGGLAQHSPTSLYFDVTPIERAYFDLFFFSALKSYKGAFHMSPDYAWWYGYAAVLGELASIRDEAERIRSEDVVRRRTNFMIYTGPLMVLAVIGFLYLIQRIVRRRRGRLQ